MISATLIADSISEYGHRLTTLQLRYPRMVHSEFMTHRMFSRNASSSRAVPTRKLIEEVRSDELRATPSFSVINAPGMQGGRETTESERNILRHQWSLAAHATAVRAELMFSLGGAKQDVNRILEPFTHINVVVTATEWDNFFGLRLHKDAQPEMQALAHAMWAAMDHEPDELDTDEWHLPYITDEDEDIETLIKMSVARCARVSYLSFETGKLSTVEEDLKLYDRLVGAHPMHASPAEHQATPDDQVWSHSRQQLIWENKRLWGNYKGWVQYRKTLPGEEIAPLPNFNNPQGSYDVDANLHRQTG